MVAASKSKDNMEMVEMVKVLLNVPGIEVNLGDSNGITPLMLAIGSCNIEMVKLFLQAPGIDVNLGNIDGVTPIMYAASKCNIEQSKEKTREKGKQISGGGEKKKR